MMDDLTVSDPGDGSLQIGSNRYMEIEPNLFQWEGGGPNYAAFREGDDGLITHFFIGTGSYERVPWYGASQTTGVFVMFFLLLFPGSIVVFAGRLVWFRSHDRHAVAPGRIAWISLLAALSNLMFVVLFGALFYVTDTQDLWPIPSRMTLPPPNLTSSP